MDKLNILKKIYNYGETLSSEELNLIVSYVNSSITAINTLIDRNNGINEGHCEIRYKNSVNQPEKPETGSNGTSDGWSSTYAYPDTNNGEITWMTICFINGESIYGAWSTPVCVTWSNIRGQQGPRGESGVRGSFNSRVFKRQNNRPDTPTGGTYNNPIPEGWSDGVPEGLAIIWSSTCTFYGNGLNSGWTPPAPESDSTTLDIEFSPNNIQPDPPTGDTPFSNHESEGWYDPNSSNFNNVGRMIWRAERKVSNGVYNGGWTITRIYGEKGDPGDPGLTGGHYEFRYNNFTPNENNSKPTKPEDGSNGLSGGWAVEQTDLTEELLRAGTATWMTQCYQNSEGVFGKWSHPTRITGTNGANGEDGMDIEFIYTRNNTGIYPPAPPTNLVNDWPRYLNGSGQYINHQTITINNNNYTWYDNPQGVTEDTMWEFVSTRTKIDNTWSEYSPPVVWSKWGEKGMDGDGFEYIYKRFQTVQNWDNITDDNNPAKWKINHAEAFQNTREYLGPTGYEWSDNPVGIDETYKYEYVSVRQEVDGEWRAYSSPTLWSGIPGGNYEFRYAKYQTSPTKPTAGTSGIDNTWKETQQTVSESEFKEGFKIWMTYCFKTVEGIYGTWKEPTRISGANGLDGEDGSDIEFIYTLSKSAEAPDAPTASHSSNSKVFSEDDWYGKDSEEVEWTDNPKGVTADNMYEYVSTREKPAGKNQSWGPFSPPALWSKWGEKGTDGDGCEYIYKVFGSIPTWANDDDNPAHWAVSTASEYLGPTGKEWSDNPHGVNSTDKYEYVSVRKKINETWRKYSTPVLWAKYSTDGSNGNHIEFRYKNAETNPGAPTGNNPSGWSVTATTPSEGIYTWMTQSTVSGSGTYGAWSYPIRITGDKGDEGADGSDIEFIYTRNNTGEAPSTPSAENTDDYIPSGWTDNPAGVTSDMKYEYISTREKAKGSTTWSSFSTPVVWAKWGEKGLDGDGYEYVYLRTTTKRTWSTDPQESTSTDEPHAWPLVDSRDYYGPENYEWSDDPKGVDSTYKYEYVAVRQRVDGHWQKFLKPVLWCNYAEALAAVPGPSGELGPMSYLAGIWDATKTYTKTNKVSPIVYRDSEDSYYYIIETNDTPTVGVAPETVNSGWAKAENYNMVFTDILFVNEFAKLGYFTVNKSWFLSAHGIIYDTNGVEHIIDNNNSWTGGGETWTQNNAYLKFNPNYVDKSEPNNINFCPYIAINASEGSSYFLKVHIKGEIIATSGVFNGTVHASAGTFNGVINATSLIAGDTTSMNIRTSSDRIEFCQGSDVRAYFIADGSGIQLHVKDNLGEEYIIDFTKWNAINSGDFHNETWYALGLSPVTLSLNSSDNKYYNDANTSSGLVNGYFYLRTNAKTYSNFIQEGDIVTKPAIFAPYTKGGKNYAIDINVVYKYTLYSFVDGVGTETTDYLYYTSSYPDTITFNNNTVVSFTYKSTYLNPRKGSLTFDYRWTSWTGTELYNRSLNYAEEINAGTYYSTSPFVYHIPLPTLLDTINNS